MAYLNKVFLMGNLTRDPELQYTTSGTPLVKFGLATNKKYKNTKSEIQNEVCYIEIECWGSRGETLAKFLKKGSPVFIEGRLKFNSWEDREGNKRNKLSLLCENFQFLAKSNPKGSGNVPPEFNNNKDEIDDILNESSDINDDEKLL